MLWPTSSAKKIGVLYVLLHGRSAEDWDVRNIVLIGVLADRKGFEVLVPFTLRDLSPGRPRARVVCCSTLGQGYYSRIADSRFTFILLRSGHSSLRQTSSACARPIQDSSMSLL